MVNLSSYSRTHSCTSNMGQFCGMPVPWLWDHQSRSACASAFWNVRPILTKIPLNLQCKRMALYYDLLTKWEGKMGEYLPQGRICGPRAVRSLHPTQSISNLSYFLCWAWLGWKWWKCLGECSELHMLNEFSSCMRLDSFFQTGSCQPVQAYTHEIT